MTESRHVRLPSTEVRNFVRAAAVNAWYERYGERPDRPDYNAGADAAIRTLACLLLPDETVPPSGHALDHIERLQKALAEREQLHADHPLQAEVERLRRVEYAASKLVNDTPKLSTVGPYASVFVDDWTSLRDALITAAEVGGQ